MKRVVIDLFRESGDNTDEFEIQEPDADGDYTISLGNKSTFVSRDALRRLVALLMRFTDGDL